MIKQIIIIISAEPGVYLGIPFTRVTVNLNRFNCINSIQEKLSANSGISDLFNKILLKTYSIKYASQSWTLLICFFSFALKQSFCENCFILLLPNSALSW